MPGIRRVVGLALALAAILAFAAPSAFAQSERVKAEAEATEQARQALGGEILELRVKGSIRVREFLGTINGGPLAIDRLVRGEAQAGDVAVTGDRKVRLEMSLPMDAVVAELIRLNEGVARSRFTEDDFKKMGALNERTSVSASGMSETMLPQASAEIEPPSDDETSDDAEPTARGGGGAPDVGVPAVPEPLSGLDKVKGNSHWKALDEAIQQRAANAAQRMATNLLQKIVLDLPVEPEVKLGDWLGNFEGGFGKMQAGLVEAMKFGRINTGYDAPASDTQPGTLIVEISARVSTAELVKIVERIGIESLTANNADQSQIVAFRDKLRVWGGALTSAEKEIVVKGTNELPIFPERDKESERLRGNE